MSQVPPPDRPSPNRPSPDSHPRVRFDHPFFTRLDDVYFRLDEYTHEPVAVARLGDETVVLPFPGIRREFKLDGTADGAMLTQVGKGLRFVKALRIGDPIPKEILTREASWEISARHKQIAYHRLALQLLGWLSGDEHIITDPEEILQVAGDPTFRRKVNAAFAEAAEAIGLGRENREQVTHYITDLANELAYVEGMRDRFHAMERMNAKIQDLRRLYGARRSVLETVDPVARLMERALDEFRSLFEQADAQTGEIISALRNIEAEKTFIQDIRDELHTKLMAWDDLLDDWDRLRVEVSDTAEELLTRTYRFLAPRYMPVDEWAMMTKLQGNAVVGGPGGQIKEKVVRGRLGGTMEWL